VKTNQKGFSVVEILIVGVVVGLFGAAGWLVYDRQNIKNDNRKASSQTTQTNTKLTDSAEQPKVQEPKKEYKEYIDDVAGYSFSFLSDWRLEENERVEKRPKAYLESPDHKVEGQGYESKQISGVSIVFSGTDIPQKDRTADNIGDTGGYACDYDKKVLTINGKKVFQCKNDTLGRQITITVFFKDNGLRLEVIKYGLKVQEANYLEAYNDIINSLKY
jgi:type II secretory pathway pseudopilin PulG